MGLRDDLRYEWSIIKNRQGSTNGVACREAWSGSATAAAFATGAISASVAQPSGAGTCGKGYAMYGWFGEGVRYCFWGLAAAIAVYIAVGLIESPSGCRRWRSSASCSSWLSSCLVCAGSLPRLVGGRERRLGDLVGQPALNRPASGRCHVAAGHQMTAPSGRCCGIDNLY